MVKGCWVLTSSAIIKVSNGVEDHLVCIFHPNPASDYDTNPSLEITQAAIGNEQIFVVLIARSRPSADIRITIYVTIRRTSLQFWRKANISCFLESVFLRICRWYSSEKPVLKFILVN
jgi:hypothetical protein